MFTLVLSELLLMPLYSILSTLPVLGGEAFTFMCGALFLCFQIAGFVSKDTGLCRKLEESFLK